MNRPGAKCGAVFYGTNGVPVAPSGPVESPSTWPTGGVGTGVGLGEGVGSGEGVGTGVGVGITVSTPICAPPSIFVPEPALSEADTGEPPDLVATFDEGLAGFSTCVVVRWRATVATGLPAAGEGMGEGDDCGVTLRTISVSFGAVGSGVCRLASQATVVVVTAAAATRPKTSSKSSALGMF